LRLKKLLGAGGCSANLAYFAETSRKITIFRVFLGNFRRIYQK